MSEWTSFLFPMASAVIGAALGALVAHFVAKAAKHKPPKKKSKKERLGAMDVILILEAVVLILYTVRVLNIFEQTGSEPSTLTTCVFTVAGFENGFLGWIKTTKIKKDEAPAIPPERKEPPDA